MFWKTLQFRSKTPVLESLLKVWRPVFKNTYFEEHLRKTVSSWLKLQTIPKTGTSLENLEDFVKLFCIRNRQKYVQCWPLKSLSLPQLTWRRRKSHPEGFCKKGAFKNFVKITEKQLCKGLFFNKDSGRGPANLFQRGSSIGVFL